MSQRLRAARARRRLNAASPSCWRCHRPMRRIWVPDIQFSDTIYSGGYVWGCNCRPDGTFDEPTIAELIDRSSLGTPEAKAIRSRTPPGVVGEIMRRVGERPR